MPHSHHKKSKRIKRFSSSSGGSTDANSHEAPEEKHPINILKDKTNSLIHRHNTFALHKSFSDMDEEIDEQVDNDDENEHKARRRSRMAVENVENLQSPNAIERVQPTNQAGMDNKLVVEHYGNCIKLAAENKITSKNAFQLHLIDYMNDMLDKITMDNFQMASSSLDASAKIYASRVDAVHQDAYKVLTGLGRSDKNEPKEDNNSQNNPDNDNSGHVDDENDFQDDNNNDDENDPKKKKLKEAREKRRRNIIIKNLNKIRVKAITFQVDVDPLFQQQAAAYDEGGTSELRLNRINVIDDSSELILDSDIKIFQRMSQTDQPISKHKATDLKMFSNLFEILNIPHKDGPMEECLSAIQPTDYPICQEFRTFDFKKSINKSGMDSITVPNSSDPLAFNAVEEISEEPNVPELNDQFNEDDDFGSPEPLASFPDSDSHIPFTEVISESRMCVNNANGNVLTESSDNQNEYSVVGTNESGTEFVVCLREMIGEKFDRFGALTDNLLGMWAGPSLWRNKLKKQSVVPKLLSMSEVDGEKRTSQEKSSGENEKKGKRKTKMPNSLTFSEPSGKKRDWSKDFSKPKKIGIILADATVLKNTKKRKKLPLGNSEEQNIFTLTLKDIAILSKTMCKSANKDTANLNEDMVSSYDFENPRDTNEFCPIQDIGFNNIGGDGDFNDDDDDDMGHPFDGIFTVPDDNNELDGDGNPLDLISQPRNVAKIDINYARVAKRINVKAVKSAIWHELLPNNIKKEEANPNRDISQLSEEDTSMLNNTGQMTENKRLTELIDAVPIRLSKQTASDLSAPVMMACLLYLSNEKELFLESTDDFKDIIISQTLPQSEIDSLRDYARKSAKTSAEVEEQRRLSLKRPHKKKQILLDSWLGDEENDLSQT